MIAWLSNRAREQPINQGRGGEGEVYSAVLVGERERERHTPLASLSWPRSPSACRERERYVASTSYPPRLDANDCGAGRGGAVR